MNQKPPIDHAAQFALLIGLVGACLVISAVLVLFLGSALMHVPSSQVLIAINQPGNINMSRFLNTLASLVSFLVPALIVARIVSKKPFSYMGFQKAISAKQLVLILALTFTCTLLSGALGALNEWIPIPATWYAKAKALEQMYETSILPMISVKNFTEYLLSLLVLGAAPAIFEEVLFRGGFQRIFVEWTKSKWAGIIITSILFSAIHYSYFGFLPRLGLGMVLGLIFYYSKNLWLNILLHFLNNALVVTHLYVTSQKGKPIEKTMDENVPVWWGLIALAVLIFLLRSFRLESARTLTANEHRIHSSPENILS